MSLKYKTNPIMKINSILSLLCTLIILISSILSCKNEEKHIKIFKNENFQITAVQNKSNSPSNYITIVGKSDDSMALKHLNLLNFSNFGFGSSIKNEEKKLVADSMHLVMKGLTSPQLMDLIAFSDREDKTGYLSRVFFTPGDTIFMEVKNGDINFSGKNAAHYNFFLKMNDPLRQNWAVYKYDAQTYKNELFTSYNIKYSLLKSYIKEHPEVSEDFIELVGNELKFEYLYNLMLPRNKEDEITKGTYRNDGNDIVSISQINNNTENLLDTKAYFNGITIEDFKRPELLNNDYFKRSLNLYIRHYFSNQDYLEYSRSNFIKEKEYIQNNLEGALETYAIGRLINDYRLKGFGHGRQDSPILLNLIKEYADRFTEESLANKMNEITEDINAIDFILPKNILDEKLLTTNGDTIQLKQILQSNKTKVIDYWASWCGPCIEEFGKAKSFKKRIQQENDLEYIYISIDSDKALWTKKITELKNTLSSKNHYLIIDIKKSKILKQMLIRDKMDKSYFSIPRYAIISAKNKVISNNSPRPSDSLVFKNIIENIY